MTIEDSRDTMPVVMRMRDSINVRRIGGLHRGQASVELAFVTPVVLLVMLIGIQYSILGLAVLGLGQVDYQGARYAATNPSATQSAVQSYMVSVASPFIST